MRQVVLDTETTGLEAKQGHRIIEIGCVELVARRHTGNHYHQYLNPDRDIDEGAVEVHGITREYLADKPRFEDAMADFLDFVKGAELIIHNAPFDVGFINSELALAGASLTNIEDACSLLDTLALARKMHPGQRNTLDALCKRYAVDNSGRELHGALLDAEILADVYLAMTGGQTDLALETDSNPARDLAERRKGEGAERSRLAVLKATSAELAAHEARLLAIDQLSDGGSLWKRLSEAPD